MNHFNQSPNKSRGGQPGNNNALKHGFYSPSYTRREDERLTTDVKGEFIDEEALIRILLARVAEDPSKENIEALRACVLGTTCLLSIHRDRKSIYNGQTTIESALQELKGLSFDQDGQPEKNETAEKDEEDEPH
jgi:hypothetical protein